MPFLDKAHQPTAKELAAELGASAAIWNGLMDHIRETCTPLSEEWKFMKSGWVLVPKRKTRTVCYLFPGEGRFEVAFCLGEKAVAVCRESKLPKRILDDIEAAKPYAEGRGIRVKAQKPADLAHLVTLVSIKMAN